MSDCGCPPGFADEDCDPDLARGFSVKRNLTRGDTIEIDYDLFDRNGAPIDLGAAGVKLWFTIKNRLSDPDVQAVAQVTLAGGGIVLRSSASSGQVRVTVPASATVNVPDGKSKLYYDLQVLDGAGRVSTVERGLFFVDPDVTKAAT